MVSLVKKILAVGLCLSTSFAAEAAGKDVVLDVIELNFKVQRQDKRSKRMWDVPVGSIKMNADMRENRIQKFNVNAYLQYVGDIYEYSADLNEIRGKTIALKTKGVSIGHVQGVQMTKDGEGLLRFTPRSSLLGKGLPSFIELNLRRLGHKKKWVVLYQNRVLKDVSFQLDKNPTEMSAMALLMSTPKVIKMETDFLGCKGPDITAMLLEYEAPELLKISKCDFSKATGEEIVSIIGNLTGRLSIFDGFYLRGKDPEVLRARMSWALEALKSSGLDLYGTSYSQQASDDLLRYIAESGHEEILKELLNRGVKPSTTRVLEGTVYNLYQYNSKIETVVKSALGERIHALIKSVSPQDLPNAADVLLVFLGYMGGGTVGQHKFEAEDSRPFPEYAKLLIQAMKDDGFDFVSKETEYNKMPATEIIKSYTEGNEDEIVYFTPEQGRELIQLLKSAGSN